MRKAIIRCLQILSAVSNPDAPAPLEDDEAETTEDNDEETDGITNEEAGLE